MRLMRLLRLLEGFFIETDMYGHKVDIYIDSKSQVKSRLGAVVSLFVLIICLINVYNDASDWFSGANLQTISSSQSFSTFELLNSNSSHRFDFDDGNFNIYFALTAQLNDTVYFFDYLERYIVQKVKYQDYRGIYHNVGFLKCLVRNKQAFLLQNFDPNNNASSPVTTCVDYNSSLAMGLIPDFTISKLGTPSIIYEISKCRNSTENNFSCASEEEIQAILPFVTAQISHPKTIFDFMNYKNPRKRSYDYQYYNLDYSSQRLYTGMLIPVYLLTDQGIINDDFVLDSLDFNQESLWPQSMMRTQDQDVLFSYSVTLGTDQQTYYRKNYKLMDVISNFGGTINIYFLLGQLICASFNQLLLKYKLINISFENLEQTKEKGKKK